MSVFVVDYKNSTARQLIGTAEHMLFGGFVCVGVGRLFHRNKVFWLMSPWQCGVYGMAVAFLLSNIVFILDRLPAVMSVREEVECCVVAASVIALSPRVAAYMGCSLSYRAATCLFLVTLVACRIANILRVSIEDYLY